MAGATLKPGSAPFWIAAYAAMTKGEADGTGRVGRIAWKSLFMPKTHAVIAA